MAERNNSLDRLEGVKRQLDLAKSFAEHGEFTEITRQNFPDISTRVLASYRIRGMFGQLVSFNMNRLSAGGDASDQEGVSQEMQDLKREIGQINRVCFPKVKGKKEYPSMFCPSTEEIAALNFFITHGLFHLINPINIPSIGALSPEELKVLITGIKTETGFIPNGK